MLAQAAALKYFFHMSRIERPRSLTSLVTDRLRQDIVTGVLPFGQALSEAAIAEKLNVSRTPVREAFARLEIEGLVRGEPQRGTFVFSVTQDELRAICDARVVLETGAMNLLDGERRKAVAGRLARIVEEMTLARKGGDDRVYLNLDTDFHQTLVDGAGNPYLDAAYQTIAPRMAALRNRLGDHPDHMAKSLREHRSIVGLIEAGDMEAARDVLIAHIGRKEGSYWNLERAD